MSKRIHRLILNLNRPEILVHETYNIFYSVIINVMTMKYRVFIIIHHITNTECERYQETVYCVWKNHSNSFMEVYSASISGATK